MRLLRKYINNRGSALFMVVSTMTALMISCMAMYFSVMSSRSTQYAIFNQQQSKQVAASANDALVAGMMDNSLEPLTNMMSRLAEGEKLTTGANGYADLGVAEGKVADADLGAYSLEITRLPNEIVGGVEKMVFDVATTSNINGTNSVYHTILYYEASSKDSPPAPTQVFAATGYVPNDVYLDGGRFMTDVFFDNEMTYVNAYGRLQSGKMMGLLGNVSTGGSLTVDGYLTPGTDKPYTYAIRDTYTANFNQPVIFSSTGEKSTVLIGGDCICNNANGFSNANVYILGDLIIRGNPDLDSSNYYVGGDVIVEGRQTQWGMAYFWVNLKNVYCNGIVDFSKDSGGGSNGGLKESALDSSRRGHTAKSWNDMASNEGVLNVTEMINELDEKTATNTYYKWVVNDSDPSKDKYIIELDESRPATVVKRTINFVSAGDNAVPTVELNYSDSEKGCIIEDVVCDNSKGVGGFTAYTLVIDTGEDEDNVYTISVRANRDFDGDGVNESFSWYPLASYNTSVNMNVLVKGRGSVVIDIPKGVTYQDVTNLKVMHYGWFVLGGGTESKVNGMTVYESLPINSGGIDNKMAGFIHRECKAGDGCSYSESSSVNKCSVCEGTMRAVKCSVHGDLNEYCPTCHPEKKNNHVGECVNHVGRSEIDKYLANHSNLKTRMTGSDGKIIYPTTNIFLVSCDESAKIRLSLYADGTTVNQNSFYGYIYAPYMTFKAQNMNSGTGGGMNRLVGGLTVSDYIIDDSMSMIACWPEKMPNDLMGEDCRNDKLTGLASKGWKISLKAH